jgi:hypothetical protein
MAVVPVKGGGPASPCPVSAGGLGCAEGYEAPEEKQVHQVFAVRRLFFETVAFTDSLSPLDPNYLPGEKARKGEKDAAKGLEEKEQGGRNVLQFKIEGPIRPRKEQPEYTYWNKAEDKA